MGGGGLNQTYINFGLWGSFVNGTLMYVANCVQQAENAIPQELSLPPSMGLLSVPSVHGHVVGVFKEAVMVYCLN